MGQGEMATTLGELESALRGKLLRPEDEGYDEARAVWNGMVDRHPAAIARCESAADVLACVRFARASGMPLSVKAGGHQSAGKAVCDDGLVVDLGEMDAVRVDPDTRTARVEPGATLGQFDREAQTFGLATPAGVHSGTGVSGLTLGGGIGWLARTFGLTSDNLVAADVVTADGELVYASEDEHADLFWALRGGGGNFGIVTSFEFQVHPVGPEVLTVQAFHRFDDARDVLRAFREVMDEAPDELGCYPMVMNVPPVEGFPEELHGKPALALVGCYSGPVAEGEQVLARVAGIGDPFLEAVAPMPYATFQSSFDAGTPDGVRYYGKAHLLPELSDGAIDALLGVVDHLPGPFTMIFFESLGGAIARRPADATAWPHRDAAFGFAVQAGWTEPGDDEEQIAWVRRVHEAMAPHTTGGVYVNYLDADDADRVTNAYGEHYRRLSEVKQRWDPDNLFRANHNVDPAGTART